MGTDDVIDGYAEALFTVARAEDALGAVEDELYAFAKSLEQHTELREALTDVALPAENKKAVIDDVLGERANRLTVSLLRFVVDAGRAREIPRIAERLADLAAGERGSALAEVRTAVELTDEQAREELWPSYKKMHDRIGGERGWGPTSIANFNSEADLGSLYVGSPETVAKKIANTARALGVARFDMKYSSGPMEHEKMLRSIELYGTKVIPMVRDLLASDKN